ncbi:MAG: class I SAM-dependent methyltransferase [Prolixibacteraceae bacterium]|nr:class I SAM-dependent methyltransferase [Prolixibacteraceae bacterium]
MMNNKHLFSTGNSTRKYYKSMNNTYQQIYGKHLMLHYPFYKGEGEGLEQRQNNLTDYCLQALPELDNKKLLEVGCGNGIQSIYIYESLKPAQMTGIDLNPDNIELALQNKNGHVNLNFMVDDAQKLETIPDKSVDVLLCIESAFHYPEKELFLDQIKRVLKPEGKFVIADIVNKKNVRLYLSKKWKHKMGFFHWTKQKYMDSFDKNGFHLDVVENITKPVMKGYKGNRHWVIRENCKSYIHYLMFRIFVIIQVQINLLLLRKREDYILFSGKIRNN